MGKNADAKVHASVWLKPDQVDVMRTACYGRFSGFLQLRNETIIALMYDAGLRFGELVDVDVSMLREANSVLYVPGHIQKDYPNDNSPNPASLELASDTARLLSSCLSTRWKDPEPLFPSRSSDRITEQGVRDLVHAAAEAAEVEPFLADGGRGDAGDVTPTRFGTRSPIE